MLTTKIPIATLKSYFDPQDRSWEEDDYDESIFDSTVTLDPNAVTLAWDRLTLDTWIYEAQSIPRTLHAALLETLKERRGIEGGE